MKINYYFLNGEHVEIETDDKFAIVVSECERLEDNLERKERYHSCSLEEREEYGIQHGKMTKELKVCSQMKCFLKHKLKSYIKQLMN